MLEGMLGDVGGAASKPPLKGQLPLKNPFEKNAF
jgi:hypothetical protein